MDEYLGAGLTQKSTPPYASPVVIIPKYSGGIQLTINYTKSNKNSILGQLPIPPVDEVLQKLGSGRGFPSLTWSLLPIKLRCTKELSPSQPSAQPHVTRERRSTWITWMVCQGCQRGHQRPNHCGRLPPWCHWLRPESVFLHHQDQGTFQATEKKQPYALAIKCEDRCHRPIFSRPHYLAHRHFAERF